MTSRAKLWAVEMLRKQWFYLLVQIIAFAFALRWIPYCDLPAPGFAVAGMAVLAAVMSVHSEMRSWQKSIWLLLMGAFLATELRAIGKDRSAQEAVFKGIRDQQDADFSRTANDLKQAINGIQSTLQMSNKQLASLENGTWDFEFDVNCGTGMTPSECAALWNSEKDHPRNTFSIYKLLEKWPQHVEDDYRVPLEWHFAFFRDPKKAQKYLEYFNNENPDEPTPELEFEVDATLAKKPELRSFLDHRLTVEIRDYVPDLNSPEAMSLDELSGSTLVVLGFSPRTPTPAIVWVHLKNGKSLAIGGKGKFRSAKVSPGIKAFEYDIPKD